MSNWLGLAPDDPFGLDNLPYGSVTDYDGRTFAAVRAGERVLDLTQTSEVCAPGLAPLFADGTLGAFLAAGRPTWTRVRGLVTAWLSDDAHRPLVERMLFALGDVVPTLPFAVADYVDFYASENHAANVGRMFRPDGDPLTPNWKHLPIGYHGRAGTVVASGTPVRRPNGQSRGADGAVRFGPSERLDVEAEIAFVVGTPSTMGTPVPLSAFADHVFGVCLLNDWSARDIQGWETVPLGPFLGKSFATSVSAWVTPLDSLASAWTDPPHRDPTPLPYLDDSAAPSALDIELAVTINGTVVAKPPFATMYWTAPQLLAHLTVNGASVRTGDLFASGTVSGPDEAQRGSLLELSWNGTRPVTLDDGTTRCFLDDGDEVVITATARAPHGRIALGEVRGRVLPAP